MNFQHHNARKPLNTAPVSALPTVAANQPQTVASLSRVAKTRLDEVFLSPGIRSELDTCLAMIREYDLLYNDWGLSTIEPCQRGVMLNFYGPPGTGKTKTAEALASELGQPILEANYATLVSELQGKTGKNIEAVFESARAEGAVLFFDEADSLLSRRVENATQGGSQDLNTAKSIMLRQLDRFEGVVIFATNLFQNYDPAFFRRITRHIGFELPCETVRNRLWQFMLSPAIPGRDTVDIEALVAYSDGLSGGDIVNVIKQTLGRLLMKNPRILCQDDLHTSIDTLRRARSAQQGIEERVLEGEEKADVLRRLAHTEASQADFQNP